MRIEGRGERARSWRSRDSERISERTRMRSKSGMGAANEDTSADAEPSAVEKWAQGSGWRTAAAQRQSTRRVVGSD